VLKNRRYEKLMMSLNYKTVDMKIVYGILFSTLYAVLNVSGAALVKSQIKNTPLHSASDYLNFLITPKVIAGLFLAFISALVMFKALTYTKFSIIIPVANGINFCITLVFGYLLFSERLTFASFLGLLLILSGIAVIGITNGN